MTKNHLADEISPYLLQHAQNPVHWYGWNEASLTKARIEKKPILLSIGYAACHWCHVMAHESFEDSETAALMNKYFINIKVDREERPDLDKIYQTAHHILRQGPGGWPLTIFLSPDTLTPFFSGTYFPRESKYNLPSFKELLIKVHEAYEKHQDEIQAQNKEVLALLTRQPVKNYNDDLSFAASEKALITFNNNFDHINGGFGAAPKFPQAPWLEFLIKMNSPLANITMSHMHRGGIYDHLSGGFFRYSVDAAWQIPHFEKMLYDNAQLIQLYQYDNNHVDIAKETADWLIDTMQSEEGGFFASIDADSEGQEGLYYIWSLSEIESNLTVDEFAIFRKRFNLLKPNFENRWFHLTINETIEHISESLRIPKDAVTSTLRTAKNKLRNVRIKRTSPAIDTKILTSWNALTIKALVNLSLKTSDPKYFHAAEKSLNLIEKRLWKDNQLLASYNLGKAHLPAYLDDYAFLIEAIVISLQYSWSNERIELAQTLMDVLLEKFFDKDKGGFYFVAKDHEQLLYRPKTLMDEVTPSGNGIATQMLIVLGFLLGKTAYLDLAEQTLKSCNHIITQYPTEHTSLLLALQLFLKPPTVIIIRGSVEEGAQWRINCKTDDNYVFVIPNNIELEALSDKKPIANKTIAYVCQGTHCLNAIESFEELKEFCENIPQTD